MFRLKRKLIDNILIFNLAFMATCNNCYVDIVMSLILNEDLEVAFANWFVQIANHR